MTMGVAGPCLDAYIQRIDELVVVPAAEVHEYLLNNLPECPIRVCLVLIFISILIQALARTRILSMRTDLPIPVYSIII